MKFPDTKFLTFIILLQDSHNWFFCM